MHGAKNARYAIIYAPKYCSHIYKQTLATMINRDVVNMRASVHEPEPPNHPLGRHIGLGLQLLQSGQA